MKNYLGLEFSNCIPQAREIAYIGDDGVQKSINSSLLAQRRTRRRLERVPHDLNAKCRKPHREPASLKAGMPRVEDTAVLPKAAIQAHRFSESEETAANAAAGKGLGSFCSCQSFQIRLSLGG